MGFPSMSETETIEPSRSCHANATSTNVHPPKLMQRVNLLLRRQRTANYTTQPLNYKKKGNNNVTKLSKNSIGRSLERSKFFPSSNGPDHRIEVHPPWG